MDRTIAGAVRDDLDTKVVLVTGPRQCGKTTLAKMLSSSYEYFNHDDAADRLALRERSWRRDVDLVVFDELHKMKKWKTWVKSVYDKEGCRPRLLVTGSANLDAYRKMGDSLAGRFFQHRLHPLDLKELRGQGNPDQLFAQLLKLGGFPEPFVRGSDTFAKRWRRSHQDVILRQDLLDLEAVRDIKGIETLVELLRHRVGSSISYSNLGRDLERDSKTVKRWLEVLENLYLIFRVTPYHRNVARALLKEPKYYFYDTAQVAGDSGVKLENLVACALLKELQTRQDQAGIRYGLHYLRTKDGREVDFFITQDEAPGLMLEVKWADDSPSRHIEHFCKQLKGDVKRMQVVANLARKKQYPDGLQIVKAAAWLQELDF